MNGMGMGMGGMPPPPATYNAPYQGKLLKKIRMVQTFSFVVIIGVLGIFIKNINTGGSDGTSAGGKTSEAPGEAIAAIVICSIAALYTLFSLNFIKDQGRRTLMILLVLDLLMLGSFVLIAVILGAPFSVTTCNQAGADNDKAQLQDLIKQLGQYKALSTTSKVSCFMTEAAWGFCIVTAILFAVSLCCLVSLTMKQRTMAKSGMGGGMGGMGGGMGGMPGMGMM